MTNLLWPEMMFDTALSISTIHHQLRAGMERTLTEVCLSNSGLISAKL
jgi:hypothetical protein